MRDEQSLSVRAGKGTEFMYLSKSTSNSEKSYSSKSKVLNKIVLEVQVKSTQLYLKYTQKYFYQPHIIIAEMTVFNVAGYLIEERRRWPVITASHGDNIPNKFRILKERHIQMRKPYQLPIWTKNSYYIVPRSGIELTTSRLHSFTVAKVSHALNHSANTSL